MKKLTLMAATIMSAATLAGTTITADAACTPNVNINSGNPRIVRVERACDINSLFSQLQNCLPGIQFPQFPQPDTETPAPELPDMETPNPELPEQESPSPELPNTNKTYIEQVVGLVNIERAKEGLSPLTLDTRVSAAAQVRAEEIVTSFSHTRPNGSSFATALKEQNISYRSAGENIAWGQKSPEEVVNAWMNSSGHRANIMSSKFTSIGVGYYQQNGVNYWCQLFTA